MFACLFYKPLNIKNQAKIAVFRIIVKDIEIMMNVLPTLFSFGFNLTFGMIASMNRIKVLQEMD